MLLDKAESPTATLKQPVVLSYKVHAPYAALQLPVVFSCNDLKPLAVFRDGKEKTYITTVVLYDDSNDLLAVAKLSQPILKSKSREALIKVKLDF